MTPASSIYGNINMRSSVNSSFSWAFLVQSRPSITVNFDENSDNLLILRQNIRHAYGNMARRGFARNKSDNDCRQIAHASWLTRASVAFFVARYRLMKLRRRHRAFDILFSSLIKPPKLHISKPKPSLAFLHFITPEAAALLNVAAAVASHALAINGTASQQWKSCTASRH